MSDYQQKRVYDWEDSFTLWAGAHLSKQRAKELSRKACRLYRVEPPRIIFHRSQQGASTYDPNDHVIRLRPRHLNAAIVLHETAHAITDKLLGSDLSAHGPAFVGVYMCLLSQFKICPEPGLYATARAAKVRFLKKEKVGPRTIRKYKNKKTK